MKDYKIIFKTKFGSHLYGTDSPESDTDYKGVFVPTNPRDVYLQRVPKTISYSTGDNKSKNTADDVDYELYSLHYFLELARKGETVALDMLHVPKGFEEITSVTWEHIRNNRSKFYTKNLKSYLGYCRTQAAKYGIKGSRLSDAKVVLKYLEDSNPQDKIRDIIKDFPKGEHIRLIEVENYHGDVRGVDVCGRKIMFDCRVYHACDIVRRFSESYGERARKAEQNEGIDWKAISHALRAGIQLRSIYLHGDIKYPLAEADMLKCVKNGELHYKEDAVGERIEDLIDEVELLAKESDYPEKVDMTQWEDMIVRVYANHLKKA